MDTLKKLWSDLYENKPLFFAVLAVVVFLLYLFWKNIAANNAAQQQAPQVLSDGTTANGGEQATKPVEILQQFITNITNPTPVTPSTGNPPAANVVPAAKPAAAPTPAKASGTPQPAVARTVTVTPWPSQNSTLWGIAQSQYGNGNLWPKIYDANKNQIKDPNLIYAGQKLVIP